MSDFIVYSKGLMEAAKGFRNRANKLENGAVKQAHLRASLLHSFSFLEAHLNYMAEHFNESPMFSVNEKGILLERQVAFENGAYTITQKAKFSRMTDRIELLLRKTSSNSSVGGDEWMSKLKAAIKIRNALVHPKDAHELTDAQLTDALDSILKGVEALYMAVFKKGLPYAKKGISGGIDL